VFVRHDRLKRALRQCAVADLAPPGRACPSCFADAKRRKIIMQNKAFRFFSTAVRVNHLRFFDGSQRREGECLSFAALENRRTMPPGQSVSSAAVLGKMGVAWSVAPLLFFKIAGSKRFLFHGFECLVDRK